MYNIQIIYIDENRYSIRWIFLSIHTATNDFKAAHSFCLKAWLTLNNACFPHIVLHLQAKYKYAIFNRLNVFFI